MKCFSQEHNISEFIKDVHGIPHSLLIHNTTDNYPVVDYLTLDGKRMFASSGVEYIEGNDSLNRYCKKMYYKLVNPAYNELNQRVFISLFFDKNLDIKEIRFLPPAILYRQEYYEELFTKIVKSTQGQWRKKVENSDWYTYNIINHYF